MSGSSTHAPLGVYPSDPQELAGGTPAENADLVERLFAGERGARREAVLLNAAAALIAAGVADDLADGWSHAEGALDSGAAGERLRELVSFSAEAVS